MLPIVYGVGTCLLLWVTCLHPALSFEHKWVAKDSVSVEDINEDFHQIFTGYKDHVDHFRFLLEEGNFMLIGGRNKVYNISLMTFKEDEDRRLTWKPKVSDENLCNSKSDPKYQSKCQNFIQVLGKIDDGKIYVCGTNAFKPKCRSYEYKEANYPIQIPEYVSNHEELGTGKSPHDPEHNSTSIYTGGKLYSATSADFLGRDPLIMMSENQIILRTAQHDSNMLSEPHFVSSIEIDDMIYIFMRENAVENINCGKATFSRVARVCKQDKGGQYEDGVWTSYFKARLNCSLPGDIPFPFNELHATSSFSQGNYMPTKDNHNRTQMFYGVFNTPDNSIQGSAVCAYVFDDVHKAFEGPFKGQRTAQHNWLRYPLDQTPSPHPAQHCVNDSKTLPDDTLKFIREHPLMDTAIAPSGGTPILIQTGMQ
ncbi:Sema domain [Mactra antiquata]